MHFESIDIKKNCKGSKCLETPCVDYNCALKAQMGRKKYEIN